MLAITIKNTFCKRMKWFSISKYKGRGQSHEILNWRLPKIPIFRRSEQLKIRPKSSQTPSPTRWRFSIFCLTADAGHCFFHTKMPGSVPKALSITLMDSLPVPYPFLLHGTHTTWKVCCFVLLTRGWGRLETRPPVALGSSPELFAFTMSLAPPVGQPF